MEECPRTVGCGWYLWRRTQPQSALCATVRYNDVRFVDFLVVDIALPHPEFDFFSFQKNFLEIIKVWRRLQQSPRLWPGPFLTRISVLVSRRKSDNRNLHAHSSTSTLRPHEQWAWEHIFSEDVLRNTTRLVSKKHV